MGIYTERKINFAFGAVVLFTAFAALYGVRLAGDPELMRDEGLYAAAASEIACDNPAVVIHGWATPECFPLFPLSASLLCRATGMPMESALRGLSVLMLLAGAVLVYVAASSRRTSCAGFVAAAMYSTSFLAMEKAAVGTPATANAFWLLAAQLVFFQYGVRKSDWNRAWIYSALLLVPGFFTGGAAVPALFAFPMLFFRRPLSVSSKFRKPGFAAALILLAAAILYWWAKYSSMPLRVSIYDVWWDNLKMHGYFKGLFAFPFELVFFLLPWSFIAWLPFCVALQSLDSTPIFSRYLRTLVFATLALLWLFPAVERGEYFCLIGPLAVLTGEFYELGVRRYGAKLRRALVLAEIFVMVVPVLIAIGGFIPAGWLEMVRIKVGLGLDFRHGAWFAVALCGLLGSSLLLAWYVHRQRNGDPVWMILLAVTVSSALVYNGLMFPYNAQDHSKREFGREIGEAIAKERAAGEMDAEKLCLLNIRGIYGGLFYTGLPVLRLASSEDIPGDRVIYLLCGTEFPRSAEYSWSSLWDKEKARNGDRNGKKEGKYDKLVLWKGVLRQPSRELNEMEDGSILRNGTNGAK